jgi:beta-glucosidase
VHWRGYLTPSETGDFMLGMQADGFARVALGGRPFVQTAGPGANLARVHLVKGQPVLVEVEYGQTSHRKPEARMIWRRAIEGPDPAALAAAKDADVVIAVVGITSRLEGEEMPVDQPGFAGGDRTTLAMPAPEEELLQAVSAAHKPLVVVLLNGSAMSVTWEKEHANAILEAWYPG